MIKDKILNFSEINKFVKDNKNKKVTLCHGVFDLLHIGHIKHFEESKKLGDILVVSLTKDEFVNKGPNRPVFNTQQRAEFISRIDVVDYVLINDYETSEKIIRFLKPKIYSKGLDYKDNKKDITNNIEIEINAIESVKGKIHYTKSAKIDASNILDQFNLIYSKEQKKFINKVRVNFDNRMLKVFEKEAREKKILVIGELIIDSYIMCDPLGKSGKGSFLTFKRGKEHKFVGGSGFVANQLGNFSNKVDLLAIMSSSNKDERFVKNNINKNVKLKVIKDKNFSTIVKTRYIEQVDFTKVVGIYDLGNTLIKESLEKKIINFLSKNKKKYDLVIVSDFGHGLITKKITKAIKDMKAFKASNAQVNSANKGERNLKKFSNFDCTVINSSELLHESGSIPDFREYYANTTKYNNDFLRLSKKLKKEIKTKTLVVTSGKSGSLLLNTKNQKIFCPAFAKNKLDKIGAGDSFFAIISLCKSCNLNEINSIFLASLAAAYTVEKFGNDKPINLNETKKILSHILI